MVPAFSYPTALVAFTAVSPMAFRRPGEITSQGASSSTFWWRLWMEQSRSPRWTTLPCLSAMIWNSTCLGFSMYFSIYMVSSENPFTDSIWAALKSSVKSSGLLEILMPLPPPPDDALIITGKPISFAMARPSSAAWTGSLLPGTTGTPASIMVFRASDLLPILLIISALGPINAILHSAHSLANLAFSDRKPNPGWMASAFMATVAARILSIFR